MGHQHHHPPANEKALKWTILLNVVITVAQIVGGLWISSMALVTDALHNFMDVAALIISYVAILLSKKPSTAQRSFGYKRAEILATFINSASIILVAGIILFESIKRLIINDTLSIDGNVVMILAGMAIFINGFSAWLLHKGAKHSMNIRSAFLHLISDTLFSVAVLIGGFLIKNYNIFWVDNVLSIVIAIYLIYSSIPLIKKSFAIVMQFSTQQIDLKTLKEQVENLNGVINIHHVHVWNLDEKHTHLEAHIKMNKELNLEEVCSILQDIENLLKREYKIAHVTLQPETGRCKSDDLIPNYN